MVSYVKFSRHLAKSRSHLKSKAQYTSSTGGNDKGSNRVKGRKARPTPGTALSTSPISSQLNSQEGAITTSISQMKKLSSVLSNISFTIKIFYNEAVFMHNV